MSDLLKIAAKQKPTRVRRSVLDPYLADLQKLQKQGYTLEQMVSALAELNVTVTKQAVHLFLKKRAKKEVNK